MADCSPVDLLPGLWAGLLGAFLAAMLRRWFDPLPGRVQAVFVAVLLILFGPALFGGKALLPLDGLRGHLPFQRLPPADPQGNFLQGDLIHLVAPSQAAVRKAWGEGRWPLWNAQVGAGMPLLADPQAQALQPLVLLGTPLPLVRAAGVVAALRVMAALVFTFLWMRRQGLGEVAALAGALAYGLGGFVLLWVGWPLANSAALLPVVLYAGARCDEPGKARDALLLALGTAALLLAGHPETILYALGLALMFLLGRVLGRPRGLRRALLARAGVALAIAGLGAAPILLPFADYLPKTLRAHRLGPSPPRPPSPDPSLPPSPGEGRKKQYASGSFPPLPSGRGGQGVRRVSLSFPSPGEGGRAGSGEGPGVRVRAAGASYIDNLSLRWLPLAAPNAFGNSRFVHYWGLTNTNEDASGFVGTATLLAALAALGVRRRFSGERVALGIAVLCLLLIAPLPGGSVLGSRRLLLPLSLCLAYLGACSLERFGHGEVRRRWLLIAALGLGAVLTWGYLAHPHPEDGRTLEVFRLGWLRWQLRFLIAAALLLLLAASWRRRGRSLAVATVAAAIAAELLLIHQPANPPMPRRLAFPAPGPIQFLQQRLGQDPRSGPRYRMAALGRAFPPNLASLYGLSDARIYNPMAPQAYMERTAPITVAWRGEVPELGRPGHDLYIRLGVRYLLADPDADLRSPLRRVYADRDGSVWERPKRHPRLFLSGPQPGERVAIPRLEDSWITARVRVNHPRRLASSLYQDGGWRLLAGGLPHPLTIDQGVFLATDLPAGRWRVDLLYRPPAFLWGCLLAALGLAGGAVIFVPRPEGFPPPGPSPPRPSSPAPSPLPHRERREKDDRSVFSCFSPLSR